MNKKQKILLKIVLCIVFIALIGAIGYYFFYYKSNREELIKISKDFVEKRAYMLVIPEEIREEEFESDKVQKFIDEAREELSKYYSKKGDSLNIEMEGLIEYYQNEFDEDNNEMVVDMESEVYQIDKVSVSLKDALVQVRVKSREHLEIYGPHTVRSLYTISFVKEHGEWKITLKEKEPIIE